MISYYQCVGTIFKGHGFAHVNWDLLVTWTESWLAALWLTLQACWLSIGAGWCDTRHGWCVSSRYFCSICVYAFNCYWRWGPHILLVWRESNRTIWLNDISPDLVYLLGCLIIFKGHWLGHINRHSFVAWGEDRLATLLLSLQAAWNGIGTSWRHFRHGWRIGCSYFGAIFVNSFDRHRGWGSNIFLIWSKGNRSIWIDGVFPYARNNLLRLTIVKGHLLGHIDWDRWIALLEDWRSCLWNTLRTWWSSRCAGWCDLGHVRCIGCSHFCAVGIDTFDCNRCCLASELLKWLEGNGIIWIDSISSFISYFQGVRPIFKSHGFAHVNWDLLVTWGEGRLTTLCLTLEASWFNIGASWCYLGHIRLVACPMCFTIGITDLNYHWVWRTIKSFDRFEGHLAGIWI